jgi:preprotein translocase subunit SecA
VEKLNFEIRKQLLEYDDVLNKQREVVYSERRKILTMDNLEEIIQKILDRVLARFFNQMSSQEKESWKNMFLEVFGFLPLNWEEIIAEDNFETIKEKLEKLIKEKYEERKMKFGEDTWKEIERIVLLYVIDKLWIEHLNDMEALREGIGLRAIAHHDPLVEYKKEAYQMFQDMVNTFDWESIRYLFNVHISEETKTANRGRRS